MSDSVWYYARGEQEKGPITTAQIKALATAGKLKREDFVWKEGMDNWVPAGEVSGLFPEDSASQADSNVELPAKRVQASRTPIPRQPGVENSIDRSLRVSRVVFVVGLLLALLSRGCDTLGDRNVTRRKAIAETDRREFQDTWDRKQSALLVAQQELQAKPNRSNADNNRLRDLTTSIAKLDAERVEASRSLASGRWFDNDQAALTAVTDDRIWGYWRQVTLLFASVLLVSSLLGVAYSSDGPERWISFVLLVVIVYSLYAADSVWSRVFS